MKMSYCSLLLILFLKAVLSVCHVEMWGFFLSFDRLYRNGIFIILVEGNFEKQFNCLH